MQSIHYAATTGKVNIIKYLVDSCNVPATITTMVSCDTSVYMHQFDAVYTRVQCILICGQKLHTLKLF